MSVQSYDVYESVVDTLKGIPELAGVVLGVFDDVELLKKLAMVPKLGVGVIYEGMRSYEEVSKSSHKTGIACSLAITIVLVVREVAFAQGIDYHTPGMKYMDAMRQKFMDTQSPTGHYWRFVAEAPAVQKSDVIVWVQRWETPVMLTKENSN